ncbi:nucleotidyltransferase [Parapedobacter sp. ISTM3]|uniref:nucleotidyltransferase domain-containing protein n=1 Tax=Parapedobacter sp. ISTM3 TaxID=2800130 RepID=UPI001902C423|nr:nucleotidyltransferase [Parapedobacter sp. ISTM3]MBK1439972.1 nucleotidyltransferase [Parapedobacter sp. ISTM3]
MIVTEKKATQIDDVLDRMAEDVQLDKTRHERMISSYEAVREWIEADEKFFKPYKYDVYPHGSVRILTTVKPIGRDEFDLDIAVHLKYGTPHTPERIYNELRRRLNEHGLYKDMLEAKNRCIRLKYAGDYHMDILPGVQEIEYDKNCIMVPDRELGSWVSSNPRGYADWFIAKANLVRESLLEKALRAENLPADDYSKKKPLQRGVQLIKRYRDIYFQKNDSYRTSSVILTTIAGQFYQGEESIFDTVDNIVTTIQSRIGQSYGRLKIINPVNPDEDFTDKWDSEPEYYEAFKRFSIHLYNEWQRLKEDNGIIEESHIMKGLFGDELFSRAQTNQATWMERYRKSNELGMDRNNGLLTSAGLSGSSVVKSNTFFGG